MKAVILAGGRGTRMSEETAILPKPMVAVGGRPILWHIMKIYEAHGICEFVVCLGYKGYAIKEYFSNYLLHTAETVEFNLSDGTTELTYSCAEPWKVTLVETGDDTQTGGRIKRIRRFVESDEAFCLTYGDGLADIDVRALVRFHFDAGASATMTVVSPPGRFGAVELEGSRVRGFVEKPAMGGQAINGGFFVLSPRVFEYISGDATVWEHEPLQHLARDGQLAAYRHSGFWQPMDTVRERDVLESHWESGNAPWLRRGG